MKTTVHLLQNNTKLGGHSERLTCAKLGDDEHDAETNAPSHNVISSIFACRVNLAYFCTLLLSYVSSFPMQV